MSFEFPCRNCGKMRNLYEYIHPCGCWNGAKPEQADVLVVKPEDLKPTKPRSEDYAAQAGRVGRKPWEGYTARTI